MKSILRTAVAGVAIASLGLSSPAWAVTADADARAVILDSLTITVVTDMLDFGSIADNGLGGTVDVDPGATAPVCAGDLVCGLAALSPSFTLEGAANLPVDISFTDPNPLLDDGAGNTMSYALESSANPVVLDVNGDGAFSVGGVLTVAAGQAAGTYTGQFEVVAVYE